MHETPRDFTRLRHQEVTNGEKRKMIAGKITDGSYTRKLSPKVNVDERREKKKTEKRIDKTIKQEESKEGKDVGECVRQYIYIKQLLIKKISRAM